ncbi:sigma-54-dependent transcriptional regulator [Acidaminobacter hydrogenoformans]|uniref:Stage 0 sporulation protein A homolog n=1 Tax=Acidaminobacter hydrogenoformans DSM 2784 TaxID=1120920 RepID=A0A1G5S665_9FIRM|nr:sigma-54 dependent transcriptional regulator [Acidaminobacter hydrogenoformans]SCZ81577.1 DNA-binding transcriptional response regulator, NtrC family, contains REC, AAA-type ATPase, and a Fis-type DNA-binding domains [Acidaminobacter hydrogenoformans DSM 2784]
MSKFKIMIVDDEAEFRDVFQLILSDQGFEVVSASSGDECLKLFKQDPVDLVVTDLKMQGMNGIELLEHLKTLDPECAVIIMTGYGTIDSAVHAMKIGAFGYIIKGHSPEVLLLEIQKLVKMNRLEKSNRRMLDCLNTLPWLLESKSEKFNQVLQLANKAAVSNANILITGESGSGKEVIANYIHHLSEHRQGPFVEVNCQVFSENTIESELFGHEKGAFTGALDKRIGRFEEANGGTLFLDEVGELSPAVQTKLLRVLDKKSFERMGSNKKMTVDFRLICATNRELRIEVEKSNFREDLFYRLNTIMIHVPPLRERREDLPELIQFFLERFKLETKKRNLEIDQSMYDTLVQYSYPGNIRELKNIIERLVVLSEDGTISAGMNNMIGISNDSARESIPMEYQPKPLRVFRKETERRHIASTIDFCQGDLKKTADTLGITRRQLFNLMRELSL